MNTKEPRPWQTLSKKTIFEHGKYLKIENHTVRLPDGAIIPDWLWVTSPDAAIVLARTEDGRFVCFRQTKYAVEGTTLAPVGGMIDPGETPLDAAKRELLEETGYESPRWVSLGSYVLDPNRGVASVHLFLALDARKITAPYSDDLEDQELLFLTRAELEQALRAGEFKVVTWSAAVALALNYLA